MLEKKEVGYVFNVGAQTEDGISIQITGNLPTGVAMPDINAEMDKWVEVAYRQRAKAVLSKEEDLLAKDEAALKNLHEQFDEQNKKEGMRAAEKRSLDNLRMSIDAAAARVGQRKAGIESLKKLI